MDPTKPVIKTQGAYLPHWTQEGATYATTFRTADSLPKAAAERLLKERRQLTRELASAGVLEHDEDMQRLKRLLSDKIDQILDQCAGSCPFRTPAAAAVLTETLMHYDGLRYKLLAYCIMPNHAHAVFIPFEGHAVQQILGTWKRYSARRVNALIGQRGEFWQEESYDHLIRGPQDFEHAVDYVLNNPARAGLKHWPWVYLARELRNK